MMFRFFFLLFSFFMLPAHAQKFLLHEYEKRHPTFISQLRMVDFNGEQEITSYGPVNSRSWVPEVLDFPELDDYLFVTTQKKKQNQIHVLNKQTLQLKTIIKTDRLTEELDNLVSVRFIRLINGGKELAMVVGKSKKKVLLIFNTTDYQEIARFPIKSKYSVTKLSSNGRFIYSKSNLVNNTKQSIEVIDLVNKKMLPSIPQGKGNTEVSDFRNFLLVHSQLRLSRKDTTKYSELKIYDLNKAADGVVKRLLSNRLQRFAELSGSELLIANRTHKIPHHIDLYKLTESGIEKTKELDVDVKLNSINYHKESDLLLLTGKGNMAVLKMSDFSVKAARGLSFNAELGLLNSTGDKGYLVSNDGTKIVLLDFQKNKIVGELSVGSANKKIGKFIANSVLMAASYYLGGVVVIPASVKGVGIMLNKSENKLFVHSMKTQDVSVYDAVNFEDKYLISDLKSAKFLYQNPKNKAPIITATDMTTTLVNSKDGTVKQEIKHDWFMGFNAEQSLMVVQNNNKALLYSTITGEKLGSVKSSHGKEAFYLIEK